MWHGKPWIAVPPLGRLPDAPQPPALHAEIERRHGMIDLLDVLEEADHPSGFTRRLLSVASREITDADTARRRKLLVSFALGSNIGIKRIADAVEGHPDDTEAAPRRFRRIYFTRENLRAAIVEIVNKTLQVRHELLWSPGTVCTSDSKQLGSWAHQTLDELGRVGLTIFLCNLLANENVRREVHEARPTCRSSGKSTGGSALVRASCPQRATRPAAAGRQDVGMSRRPTGMGQATPRAREGSSGVAVGPCRLGDQAGDGRRLGHVDGVAAGDFGGTSPKRTRDASGLGDERSPGAEQNAVAPLLTDNRC